MSSEHEVITVRKCKSLYFANLEVQSIKTEGDTALTVPREITWTVKKREVRDQVYWGDSHSRLPG
jgi:hypothetical protein